MERTHSGCIHKKKQLPAWEAVKDFRIWKPGGRRAAPPYSRCEPLRLREERDLEGESFGVEAVPL